MKRLQENLISLADPLSNAGGKRPTRPTFGAFRRRLVRAAIRFFSRTLDH